MGKNVYLLHNPSAGDGKHTEEELISILETAGHTVNYASVKVKGWKKIPREADWLVLAGGDGTVKRVVQWLHTAKQKARALPIGLLPMGTANNIAVTLGIKGDIASVVASWTGKTVPFDTGVIEYGKKAVVFGEGAGIGLFPSHIHAMMKKGSTDATPQQKMEADRRAMIDSARTHQPQFIELEIDGTKEHGEFLMVEAMNIRSIGSNYVLAPKADPGDQLFDLILVRERNRKQLVDYLISVASGKNVRHGMEAIPFRNLVFNAPGGHLHVDDEVVTSDKKLRGSIALSEYQLSFLK